MERIKKNIPNLITLGNLTCGLLSILFAFEGNLVLAGTFIFYGAILDFFDGFAARLLKVNSEIGKQLDSMAVW
jgi:CDP-diacylglycerol--serine O-phosphatidyltransferase